MARAKSSFPDPLGPWISTVLSLSAISGRMAKMACIRWFWLIMSWKEAFWVSSFLRASMGDRSRKVSTPPMISPFSFLRTAVLIVVGISRPSLVKILTDRLTITSRVFIVSFKAHRVWQILVRKTSKQYLPMASLRLNPVISSAARLKDVICPFALMVNTPSATLSRMILKKRSLSSLFMW
jgi:hypothetical protein